MKLLIILLLFCNIAQANQLSDIEKSDQSPKLEFLPKTLKYFKDQKLLIQAKYEKTKGKSPALRSYTFHLKEFKVGAKYCLFGTRHWDDECQDKGMEFLYGEKWREIKKIALDFIEYTNKDEIEKIIELLNNDGSSVFLWGGRPTKYVPKDPKKYSEVLFKEFINIKKEEPKISEYDLYVVKESMRYWKTALKGTNYKNFRLYYYAYDQEMPAVRIFLSNYLFIDIDDRDVNIEDIGYF